MPKHTKQVTEQTLTLSSMSDLLDRKLDEKLDLRFEQIDQRFDTLEKKLDQTIAVVADLKEDMDIVKDFLTTQVMTKADGREIMTIVNRHTKEIKELQAIAGY